MGIGQDPDRSGRRFLVTMAVNRYPKLAASAQLAQPKQDARRLLELLQPMGYEQDLIIGDYWSAQQVRMGLSQWVKDVGFDDNDVVVFYFAGHSVVEDRDRHYLLCWDSDDEETTATALATEDLARILARSGLRNSLFILDTCYAAAGAADSIAVVLNSIARRLGGDASTGIWFLSSARMKQEASDGAFVDVLAETLADVKERTGQRQRYLDLTNVAEALNRRFRARGLAQRAELSATAVTGLAPFLPNDGYQPDFPREDTDLELQRRFARELHDHFGPRSRGVDFDSEQGLYFHGRARILRELLDWLTAERSDGRGRIVTGSPGCGKSAVLGRLVAMSDPVYREWLLQEPRPPGAGVPANLVDVAVHGRHKRLPELVEQIAASLDLAADGPGSLFRQLSLAVRDRGRPFVVVVDALDEAGSGTAADTGGRGEPRRIARELLRPLSEIPGVRLLVGTRSELVGSLGTGMLVCDLDDADYLGEHDIAEYVTKVLLAENEPELPTPYRQLPEVARAVGRAVEDRADRVFLVARMTARGLRTDTKPVDVTQPGWYDSLPSEIGEAFEDYLSRFGAEETRVRTLLYPLAFAEGKGLPRGELWTGLAGALSRTQVDDDDIEWLLEKAQAYIAEVTDQGRSVYRLYHQALAEHLRSVYHGDAQLRIVRALLDLVPPSGAAPHDFLAAPAYVRTHLATHAAAAGHLDDLLGEPSFLLAAEQLALLRALPSARSEPARRARNAYEQAAHQLADTVSLGERAAYLQLSAHRCAAESLAGRITGLGVPMPWQARWAWWSTTGVHRQLIGHERSLTTAAIGDLDGTPIAVTGGADGTARIWDLVTQRELGEPLEPGCRRVSAVAIGELGDYSVVVTGGDDGRLQVWDLSTGLPLGEPIAAHTNEVTAIVLLAQDGRQLAVTASRDGTVRVWNLADGTVLGNPMVGHASPVNAITVAEDNGRTLVLTGGDDNRVRVWDLASRQQVGAELIGHQSAVTGIGAVTVDGRQVVVTGSRDGTMGLWDLSTRRQLGEPVFSHLSTQDNYFNGVLAIATGDLNGLPVAVTCGRDVARVWNLLTRQQIGQPLRGHYGEISAVVLGSAGRTPVALTAGKDNSARIWDLTADNPIAGHSRDVDSVTIGRVAGRCLAVTGGVDTTAVVWDLDVGGDQDGPPLAGHRSSVTAVALGERSGQPVAVTGSRDGELSIWNLHTRQPLMTPLAAHSGPIRALELTRIDGTLLVASGSEDGTVRLWNPWSSREPSRELVGHSGDVIMLALGEVAGRSLVLAADRSHATVWEARTAQVLGSLRFDPEQWKAMAVGVVGGRAAALLADNGNILQLWDLLAGNPISARLVGHTDSLERAVLGHHGGGPIAVTASNHGQIRVWDLRSGQTIGSPLIGQPGGTRALAVGPMATGTAVLAIGDQPYMQQTRLWSLDSFQQCGDALTGTTKEVGSLALAEAGGARMVVSAGDDGSVRVRELGTGLLVGAVLNGHESTVMSVAVADLDGPVAVSASWDQSVRVWDLASYEQRFRWAHTDHGMHLVTARRHGRPVAGLAAGSTVTVWDLADRSLLGELTGHTGAIEALAAADLAGAAMLLSGGSDGTGRLWNLNSLAPAGPPLTSEEVVIQAVALGPADGGLTAYTGDDKGTIRVWDPMTGVALRNTVPALERYVSILSCAEMHGQRVLGIGGDGGVVRLWSIDDERPVLDLQLATSPQDLLLTPDGYVGIATAMGIVALWVADWTAGSGG